MKSGNFSQAVQLNETAKTYREKTKDILAQMKELNNKIASEQLAADKADFNRTRNISIVLICVALLVGLTLALFLSSMISNPIKAAEQHAGFMAGGDFTQEVPKEFLRRRKEASDRSGAGIFGKATAACVEAV